ncbi:MAG: hypothetical protein JST16_14290 [Bdellovibrionales bacterium]|nr:hypothetical protein [Bdellovibrionales bacterium]
MGLGNIISIWISSTWTPIQACTFPDIDERTIFIGLTRRLVEELLVTSKTTAASEPVRVLIGCDNADRSVDTLETVLFHLQVQFLVGREVGHYLFGHIVESSAVFEFSGADAEDLNQNLNAQRDELAVDAYSVKAICQNLIEGDIGAELRAILPSKAGLTDDQLLTLLAIATTGVFLLHLNRSDSSTLTSCQGKHPPLVLRQHRIFEAIVRYLGEGGKDPETILSLYPRITEVVGTALPVEVRIRWNAQVTFLESMEGKQYLKII